MRLGERVDGLAGHRRVHADMIELLDDTGAELDTGNGDTGRALDVLELDTGRTDTGSSETGL